MAPGHRAQTHILPHKAQEGGFLQRRKLRLREVQQLARGHVAGEWDSRIQTQFCLLLNHQYLPALLASPEGPQLRGIQDWDLGRP